MKTAEKTIVYWNRLGRTACEKHIPSRNSDTWIIEAWEAVPIDTKTQGIDCEICKQKRSEKQVKALREDLPLDMVERLVPFWNYDTEVDTDADGKTTITEIMDIRTYPVSKMEIDYVEFINWIFSEDGKDADNFDDSRDYDSFMFDVEHVRTNLRAIV